MQPYFVEAPVRILVWLDLQIYESVVLDTASLRSLTLRQKSRDLPRLAFSPWRKDPADSAHAGGACALHLSRLCKIGSARWLASQSTAETVAPGCRKSAGLLAARRALQQPTWRDQLPWAFQQQRRVLLAWRRPDRPGQLPRLAGRQSRVVARYPMLIRST